MDENEGRLIRIFRDLDWTSGLEIALIVLVAWLLTIGAQRAIPWVAARVRGPLRMKILPWVPVVRFLILVTALALIIPVLIRPTLENMVAIFGALALAIGFAFKDYVSDVVAGIVALIERPYRPGDWVRIDGAYGEVTSVGLRSLSIVTPDDDVVFIPHSKLWSTNVYNANAGRRQLLCVADFFLKPDHDAAAVRQYLGDAALSSPYIDLDRSVCVILADEPWGTHYRLKAYPIDGRYQFEFISDLTVRARAVFARLGVEPVAAPPAKEYGASDEPVSWK
jgi:small-conductance mechanosensitive channel